LGICRRLSGELPVTRRIRFRRIVVSAVAYPYAERPRASGTAVAVVGCWLLVCNLDELLAQVLPGEEAPQGVRGILEPLDHIDLIRDLSLASPAG
jgi:hypothetical protein